MNNKNIFIAFLAIASISLFLSSCKPDANNCENCENELITTLYVALTDSATNITQHYIFRDLDGDGANQPVRFDTIKLQANHTYTAMLTVLDESKSPADTTSNEILEEANDHQFFFHAHGTTVNFSYLDFDSNNPPLPLGLQTKWYVGATTTNNGQVHIELKHQPGTKNGSSTTGETDLSIEFNAIVQ